MGQKIGQKLENGARPDMGKHGPKMVKHGIWTHFSIFCSPSLGHSNQAAGLANP